MRRAALAFVALALAACSDDGGDSATGPRLQATGFVGEGGAVSGSLTYDTRYATPCTPGLDTSGQYRCFPAASAALGEVFADAACTVPAVKKVEGPLFVRLVESGCEASVSERFRAGRDVPTVFALEDGVCRAGPVFAGAYAEAERVPDAEFIALERVMLWYADDLGAAVFRAADGFEMFGGFFDAATNARCFLKTTVDGERCLPDEAAPVFRDSDCSEASTQVAVSRCADRLRHVTVRGVCSVEPYRVSSRAPTGGFAGMPPLSCRSLEDDAVVYNATPASATELPEVTRSRSGANRLQAFRIDGAPTEAVAVASGAFFDAERGVECEPRYVGSGYLCLPTSGLVRTYYTDAACEAPVELAVSRRLDRVKVLIGDGRVYEPGEVFSGTVFERGTRGCVEVPACLVAREVGAEIERGAFVALEEGPLP